MNLHIENATSRENRVFNFSGGIPLDLYRIKLRQLSNENLSHSRAPPPPEKNKRIKSPFYSIMFYYGKSNIYLKYLNVII